MVRGVERLSEVVSILSMFFSFFFGLALLHRATIYLHAPLTD